MDFGGLKQVVRGKVSLAVRADAYTTYHLGGPLGALVEPKDAGDLAVLLSHLHTRSARFLILGGGSNVLFADKGFNGVVVKLGKNFQNVRVEGERLRVGAGTRLVTLMNKAREEGLGGLEFCAGIPGDVGGAVAGNAGARDAWIGPRVEELTVVTPQGEVKRLGKGDYEVSYRRSSLQKTGDVVVEVVIRADREPKDVIEAKIRDYFKKRRGRQPRTERNAGSVFKNPSGNAAGKLSEEAGMKGFRVGGARVSEVHANFIVSEGGKAADVVAVMREVQKRVKEKSGVKLEPEILPLGDWDWPSVADVWWNRQGPVFFTA